MKKLISTLLILSFAIFLTSFTACHRGEKGYAKYEITAEYAPSEKAVRGALKVTYQNGEEDTVSVLKFQLYPNAYREKAIYKPVSSAYQTAAYYAGESYGEIVIHSVNGCKNWEVMGEDENILYVYLERDLYPGDRVVLDIGFTSKLAQVNHRLGITEKAVNLGNFFPILCGEKRGGFYETAYYNVGDPFYSDCADYKVTLTLPKEYEVASTGEITSERVLERKKAYTMYATNVRDFAMVLSDKFKTEKVEMNGKTLFYHYLSDENAKETISLIKECFSYYETAFGKYPYDTYTVAETGFCLGGMEYPALSMISSALNKKERAKAVAHETAHQWWYAVVGNDQLERSWQDEGLAEYSAICFFEKYEKYGVTREGAVAQSLKEYRSYYDVYGSVLGRTDTNMNRHLKEYLSDYEYRCIAYDKAVVMFDTLRKSIGDKRFFSGLKRYYTANKFSIASAESLIGAFEKTGSDVHGFFESFLDGKAIL